MRPLKEAIKKYSLILFLTGMAGFSHAQNSLGATGQEAMERSNYPLPGIHEHDTVLNSDKEIKRGLLRAFLVEKVRVASGR